jgi:hypothetical protein|tara:strand:+ start:3629 stop:3772 length:144 start_codon:yes stop_codon:yes gene_type:complete
MTDIDKLIEEADKNCQEMVVHLKECIKILERIEDMCERAINEVNEQT